MALFAYAPPAPPRYLTSVSILNIGMYIEMITMPTDADADHHDRLDDRGQ